MLSYMITKLNVLGVCAGQGVALFPFHRSKHFRVIGNIEPRAVFYSKENPQWKANFGDIPMIREGKSPRKRVDVIIGHPDCGDSSILRMSRAKQRGSVKSNVSVGVYIRGIQKYRPKYFLLENLPGFLDQFPLEELNYLLPEYQIQVLVSSVAYYGNSQISRVRLVIVGTLKQISQPLQFPLGVMKEVLHPAEFFELGTKEIPEIGHIREPLTKLTNLYLGDRRQITYAEARDRWVDELNDSSRWPVGGKMKNQPGVSKHVKGQFPYTVRKQNRQFGTSGLVLSPREMANIQGIPLDFKLYHSESNSIYWMNKMRLSVTKTMPMQIATWFMRQIRKQHRSTKK